MEYRRDEMKWGQQFYFWLHYFLGWLFTLEYNTFYSVNAEFKDMWSEHEWNFRDLQQNTVIIFF